MKQPLTAKQQQVLNFIQQYIDQNQVPPSLREIGTYLDLSVGTVQDQVEAIRRKGYLEKEKTKARGLRLPAMAQQVPILGRVHAGPWHAAFENVEGYLPVGSSLAPSRHFALKIHGDSMIDAGILDGDHVIVRTDTSAQEGDIVVARVEDETTVKRLIEKNGRPVLKPENSKYPLIDDVHFEIVGVVVEVRRQYHKWRR